VWGPSGVEKKVRELLRGTRSPVEGGVDRGTFRSTKEDKGEEGGKIGRGY